jgi:hypothetical protein
MGIMLIYFLTEAFGNGGGDGYIYDIPNEYRHCIEL